MKAYFKTNRKQRFGVVILSSLIVLFVFLLNVNDHRELGDPLDVKVSEINFDRSDGEVEYTKDKNDTNQKENNFYKKDVKLSDFDPNELDQSGWEELGFSEKQAASIINYRNNYGPFKRPEDIEKLYVVSEEKYDEIKPFMIFPEGNLLTEKEEIEVNSASQDELESIRGIGPVFANRIIKFRKILGGFSEKDQFREVYGMTEEAFTALSEGVTIDKSKIDRININKASKDDLRAHPYLKKWEVTSEILTRRQQEELRDLQFLVTEQLISPEELKRLKPYITFE